MLNTSDHDYLPSDCPQTLIIDLSRGYGGSSSRVFNLLTHFPPGRMALASMNHSEITRLAQAQGLPVYTVGTRKVDPRILGRLIHAIRHSKAQVIDTYNIQAKLWGSLAAARTGVALVSTINSWYYAEHGGNLKGRFYQALELRTNRQLDRYICISKDVYDRLIEAGMPPHKVELIANAIEIHPPDIPGDKAWLRTTYHLPEQAVVACAVGRMVWAKGYVDLIQAFERIKDHQPNLHCLILGDGDLQPELEAQIQQAGLADRFHLLGFVDHDAVLSVIKASDFFVMPSRSEGTPIALLEAAALARPILATRAGGIPELVSDGEQAILVEVGDVVGLAKGLVRLVQVPDFAQQLGRRAREHVLEHFSLRAQVHATTRAYATALDHAQQRLGRAITPAKDL